jgi:putative heme-binding domain-containing protein
MNYLAKITRSYALVTVGIIAVMVFSLCAPSAQAAEDADLISQLVAAAKRNGNARRGMEVLRSARFACLSCHRVGRHGGTIGPPLSEIGKSLSAEQIAEALLWPRRQVKPEYVAWQITTSDGRLLQGYKQKIAPGAIELLETSSGKPVRLNAADIAD